MTVSLHPKNVLLFAGRMDAAADDADMMSYAGTEESRSVSDSTALLCHVGPSAFCVWQLRLYAIWFDFSCSWRKHSISLFGVSSINQLL